MAPQYGQIAEMHNAPVHRANNSYTAVVVRIGDEPLLNIRGVGNVRFAYRHVKKAPGEAKPVVHVGDRVTCRLTPCSPPKAVSVRIQASAAAVPQPASPMAAQVSSTNIMSFQLTASPVMNLPVMSLSSVADMPTTPLRQPRGSLASQQAPMSSSETSLSDALTEQSELTAVSYSHDPYSMSAVKLEYAPATPNASMRSMGNTSFFMSPASSPRHGH
eukprot:TRINITY_DN1460_c0_g1_i2.p1 TRINITY_DN1460_c0_g1~~TRINITY_DN1460_c0_g1_i2.p1  ORF type:complete len:217 (+),score=69.50 TRINITY_DN1460_c0_g1_i2:66-716(+)